MKVENDFMNNLYDHGLPMSDNWFFFVNNLFKLS
jgi:hypothetical protein